MILHLEKKKIIGNLQVPEHQHIKEDFTQTELRKTLEKYDILDFKLTDEEMAEIAKLDKKERYYHRTDEQLIQFAGWKPDFEK